MNDVSGSFGPIDAGALREIRNLARRSEPLVETTRLDNPIDPQTLSIELSDGIGDATVSRLDVRWSLTGDYRFHYTDDEDRDCRFDRHAKPDAPRRHSTHRQTPQVVPSRRRASGFGEQNWWRVPFSSCGAGRTTGVTSTASTTLATRREPLPASPA